MFLSKRPRTELNNDPHTSSNTGSRDGSDIGQEEDFDMLSVMELSDKTLQDPSNVLDDEISFKSDDKTLQGPSKVLDDEISFESDDNMTMQNSQDILAVKTRNIWKVDSFSKLNRF